MANKIHMSVVRDAGYQRGEFNTRGRHNERKNEEYGNGDIVPERIPLNVHFHQNLRPDGTPETYEETYNRLLDSGRISEKWQKPDSAQFAEMVLDVNTEYFEERGGYEYAKEFFEEAYRFALKEIGSEEFVISAVLHADERNAKLSEQLGRDAFHYHLHVVYVPVVEKREYFRRKNPDQPAELKEVYMQVAHSKKWPIKTHAVRDGKHYFVNAYSLLQDRYFGHMKAAGFEGFVRGERGSTNEHLEVLDYKIQQDTARSDALDKDIKGKEQTAAALAEQAAQTAQQLASLEKKTAFAKKKVATFADIDRVGAKHSLMGNVPVSQADWKMLSNLAKEGIKSRDTIQELRQMTEAQATEIAGMKTKLKRYGEGIGITDNMRYLQAKQRAPRRLSEAVSEIMRQPPERTDPERTVPQRKRGLEIGG